MHSAPAPKQTNNIYIYQCLSHSSFDTLYYDKMTMVLQALALHWFAKLSWYRYLHAVWHIKPPQSYHHFRIDRLDTMSSSKLVCKEDHKL